VKSGGEGLRKVADIKDRIGRYEIEGVIGEGAAAVVYRAHDPKIDRTIAIKVLKQDKGLDAEYLTRFQREAKSAGAISHPNIVTIYDLGHVGAQPYIAMEFVKARPLDSILAAEGSFSLKQTVRIGIQMAEALDYAHRQGVIHRDIKPANILVLEDGETVKLTDFGVAHLPGRDELQATRTGSMLGTPRYMSPEQVAGREIDGRSDLFSLGAILYELLARRRAFDSDNIGLLMVQILQQDPPAIAKFAKDVPDGVARAVMRLLRKRPEQRFSSGAELAGLLKRELKALEDAEEDKRRDRILPLRLKLAGLAGLTLAVLFALSMSVIYDVEAKVVENRVLESGASLAKFVAVETAVPVLGQNWLPLKLFVADAKERGSFDYLAVTDHKGIVQASTDSAILGKSLEPPHARTLRRAPDLIASVTRLNGRAMFLFQTPILFHKTEIGRLYLGIARAGTDQVLKATLWLLAALGLFSVLAVAGLSYVLGAMMARRLRLLKEALLAFAAGDRERRVPQSAADEIGQLFSAFNQMADQLQRTDKDEEEVRDAPKPAAMVNADCAADETMMLKRAGS
jgi:eukaryotic-like serine/threonine-protein kinase